MKYRLLDSVRRGEWIYCVANGFAVRASQSERLSKSDVADMISNPASYCKADKNYSAGEEIENNRGLAA